MSEKIRSILGKAKNRIYRVGIELEGGWINPGVRITHDGSVAFADEMQSIQARAYLEKGENWLRSTFGYDPGAIKRLKTLAEKYPDFKTPPTATGEIPSPPLEVKEFPTWMISNYPPCVNATCGMHVHMSFANALLYQKLMTKDFPDLVLAEIIRWAEEEKIPPSHWIWPRLKGKNRYCENKFHADEQAMRNDKRDEKRRTVINYCYSLHSTVECRLLPMFKDPYQAVRAIQRLLDITNAFLATTPREARENYSVDLEGGSINEMEEIRICV